MRLTQWMLTSPSPFGVIFTEYLRWSVTVVNSLAVPLVTLISLSSRPTISSLAAIDIVNVAAEFVFGGTFEIAMSGLSSSVYAVMVLSVKPQRGRIGSAGVDRG